MTTPSLLRRASARLRPAPRPQPPTDASLDTPEQTPEQTPTPRRGTKAVAAATAVALLAGGSAAVAHAHKTVTLDVDGELVEVSTFAGSVDGVLEARGVDVGERDMVAPGVDAPLGDGDEIVVRFARQLTVLDGGEESTVWTTALSAEEALGTLAARGQDIRLVASRSAASGRAELPVVLGAGPVDVVADGTTHAVADGSRGLHEVLADLGITVGELDRVQVITPAAGVVARLTVQVQRVVAQEVSTTSEIPFETTTEQTDDLYTGQRRTAVAGVPGQLTIVDRVILVDGVEESRRRLSEAVTAAPVTAVVREGTRARPVAPAPAAGGAVVTGDVWGALARCESGGNPTIVSRNGLYHGLYQFSVGTWQGVGGAGLPSQATPEEQTLRAQLLQARSGWGQWPACSSKLGLR